MRVLCYPRIQDGLLPVHLLVTFSSVLYFDHRKISISQTLFNVRKKFILFLTYHA